MSFLNYFANWTNKTMTRLTKSRTWDPATGSWGPDEWSADAVPVTFSGSIWNKAEAEQFISEQFREEVTDVFVTDYTEDIPADCRLTDGTDTWGVVTRQDIGYQQDVLLVGIKRV